MLSAKNWVASLYPNPTRGTAWLQVENLEGPVLVELYDGLGRQLSMREVEVGGMATIPLEVANLEPNLYFVKVTS